MSKPKNICINLNRANQTSNGEKDRLLPNGSEHLNRLIKERIYEITSYNSKNNNEYNELKRHDSILIDGTRGTGKTTVIERMRSDSEILDSSFVLDLIDPNQLDKSTNILDIIISNIYESLKRNLKYIKEIHSVDYSEICTLKQKIDKTIFDAEKKNYESISNKYTTTKSEMVLDQTIHTFALKVCKLLGKKALILPIDDIDMSVDHGKEIVETLRKYLQTPRIIPVIALDAAQIYALVKKSYFEQFKYEAKTPINDISSKSELSFLKKLPSEYIQKILPPSQRIVLPDMLGHYKTHLDDNKPDVFFEHTCIRCENTPPITLKLSFDELLKLIMSVLFEYDGEKILDPSVTDYHVTNYLKNKTFRSFVDDARAIFESLSVDIRNPEISDTFIVDRQRIKERFKMYSKNHSSNKHDSALWFWNNYIERLEVLNNQEENPYLNIANEVLIISTNDSLNLERREKIYHRLYLQDFYLEEIIVTFKNRKIKKIKKKINTPGFLEFMLRTTFPAMLFEELYNSGFISLDMFPIERLREFSKSDAYSSLTELYDNFIPFWGDAYSQDPSKKIKLRFEIQESMTRPYRKDFLNFTVRDNIKTGEQEYFWHPFKIYVFFSLIAQELANQKNISESSIFSYMPKGYLNIEGSTISKLLENVMSYKDRANYCIYVKNSGIGIISSLQHTLQCTKNIINILGTRKLQYNNYQNLLAGKYNLDTKNIKTLFRIDVEKEMANLEAIVLNCLIISFIDQNYNNYIYPEKYISKHSKNQKVSSFSHRLNINKDTIYSAAKEKRILLPFIDDDPFLRNLDLMRDISGLDQLVYYAEFYIQISKINISYLFANGLSRKLNQLLHKPLMNERKAPFFYSSRENHTLLYVSKVLNSKVKKEAYFELIISILKRNDKIKKALKKAYYLDLEIDLIWDKFPNSILKTNGDEIYLDNLKSNILKKLQSININNISPGKVIIELQTFFRSEYKHKKYITLLNEVAENLVEKKTAEKKLFNEIQNERSICLKNNSYIDNNILILLKDAISFNPSFIRNLGNEFFNK